MREFNYNNSGRDKCEINIGARIKIEQDSKNIRLRNTCFQRGPAQGANLPALLFHEIMEGKINDSAPVAFSNET